MAITTVVDRSSIPDDLKVDYVNGLNEQLVTARPLYEDLQKGKKYPLIGSDMQILLHLQRNGIVQAMVGGDFLPNSTAPHLIKATLRSGMVAVGMIVDNTLKLISKTDKAAYVNGLAAILEDARSAMFFDVERTDFGDGTGVLATVATTVTGFTVVFDSNQNFIVGMKVDLWTTNTLTAAGLIVTDISEDGVSVTFDTSATWTITTSVAIRFNNASVVGGVRTSKETNGLRSITSTTTFMGVDPSTEPAWKALRIAANGPLDPQTIAKIGILFRIRSEGLTPSSMYVHPIQSYYLVYGTKGSNADRRFTQGDLNKFGTETPEDSYNFGAGGVKIKQSYLCPVTDAFAIVAQHAIQGETSPIAMEDWDGQTTFPYIDGTGFKPATVQWLTYRQNIGCMRRRSFARITGLTNPDVSGLFSPGTVA